MIINNNEMEKIKFVNGPGTNFFLYKTEDYLLVSFQQVLEYFEKSSTTLSKQFSLSRVPPIKRKLRLGCL